MPGLRGEPLSMRTSQLSPSTLVMMTVDTEEEWNWADGWPTGQASVRNVARLRRFQQLCDQYEIATTYFANFAVLNDQRSSVVIRELARQRRVEIGLHIHPWNTPPLNTERPGQAHDTFLHNLPTHLVTAKLTTVLDAFSGNGLTPTSFRGGRYSTDVRIQDFLRDRGFLADASILPFTTWADAGAPDFRQHGLEPRRRAPRHQDDPPLWEIPLTLAFTRRPYKFWRRCYEAVEQSVLGRLHIIGIVERLGIVRRVWLNFECETSAHILKLLDKLRLQNLQCVCLTVHSSSLLAGTGPYTRTAMDEQRLFDAVDRVFDKIRAVTEFESVTMTEAAVRLEERFHACLRN